MKCPYCDGTGELTSPSVGTAILAIRKIREMTQQDLAKACGLSRPQITNIEAGRSDTSVSMLMAIADALSVSAKDLLP